MFHVSSLGLKLVGYKADIRALPALDKEMPCIVFMKHKGCRWEQKLPLIEGIDAKHVYLADPCLGYRRFTLSEFKDIWDGTVFIIYFEKLQALRVYDSTCARAWIFQSRSRKSLMVDIPLKVPQSAVSRSVR